YRSTVFPVNDEQARVTEAYIQQLDAAKVFKRKIATTIEPAKPFYVAEDYHQNFLVLNPTYPYIAYVDMPKIENLKRLFADLYRDEPVLVKVKS
ncbi:MAG: peptide-methionine (S)-S-oxide reductase, partial [Sphingomonadales bacterium]